MLINFISKTPHKTWGVFLLCYTFIMRTEKAIFAAGCFWGVEEAFRTLPGVIGTRVGYTGGSFENPKYKDTWNSKSGHAEAVEVTYDSDKIEYQALLNIFWKNHNPTTKDRQGPDIGTQYRSAIFYESDEQKNIAEKSKSELGASGYWKDPIVTEISPAVKFWPAEEYHQKYLMKVGKKVC